MDGVCYCWDKSRPQIPPAPGTRHYNGGEGLNISTVNPCDIITHEVFDALAPNAQPPYSYDGFCQAVDTYNINHPKEGVFNMGSVHQQSAELAAFFGNALHESDEFKAGREYLMCADHMEVAGEIYCRPCDSSSFDWDNMLCPEGASLASGGRPFNGYCQSNLLPPEGCACDDVYERMDKGPMAGYIKANEVYFGRGSIQLSWNYNYIRASIALTGAAQTFCQRPDLVAMNEEYAWGAGLFYWMENIKNDKTCHQSVLIEDDFGSTLDNINGGLECPADDHGWHGKAVQLRLARYCRAATAIGVEKLLKLDGCIDMNKRMKQCLDEGTCKECQVWKDSLDLGIYSDANLASNVVASESSAHDNGGGASYCASFTKEKKCMQDGGCKWKGGSCVAMGDNSGPDQSNNQEAELTKEEKDEIKQQQQAAKQQAKEEAAAAEAAAAASNADDDDDDIEQTTSSPTAKPSHHPTSKPTMKVVNPISSSASSFGVISMPTQSAEQPSSSTEGQSEEEDNTVPKLDTSLASSISESMTNWANTNLEDDPTELSNEINDDVTTPTPPPTFLPTKPPTSKPTNKPVKVINIADTFKQPSSDNSSEEKQQIDIVAALPTLKEEVEDESATSSTSSYFTKLDDGSYVFSPLDDVTISRSYPSTNFGSEPSIAIDMLEGDAALFRFDLSVTEDYVIHTAILRLTIHEEDDAVKRSGVYYIQPTEDGWTEDKVTYDTAPKAKGVLFASVVSGQTDDSRVDLDVTNAVANHIINFRVVGTDRTRSVFTSKESSNTENAPVLIVELESSSETAVADEIVVWPDTEMQLEQSATDEDDVDADAEGESEFLGSVSGHIWHDKNVDGIQDPFEPGLRGILVDLYKCEMDKWIEGTRTTSSGDFIFDELTEGEYYVLVTTSSDYSFTPKNTATDYPAAKNSNVDPSTGRGDCIELSATLEKLSATVNAGINVSLTKSGDDSNYNCRGNPCPEGEGYCRSKHNFCGSGEEYCNEGSQWTPECGTVRPTYRPSTSPVTDVPTFAHDYEVHCSGDPCQKDGECRSFIGYCGSSPLYCNSDSVWVPDCIVPLTSLKPPTKSPLSGGMTASPTDYDLTPTSSPLAKDNTGFSPFILPTLTKIDTPKQIDINIVAMKENDDKDEETASSFDTDDTVESKIDNDGQDEVSAWYIRYSDPRNEGSAQQLFICIYYVLPCSLLLITFS